MSLSADHLEKTPENGEIKELYGKECIYIDGYWMRYYEVPPRTWAERKNLILSLTKRVFHHTEDGINSPGSRLDLAREHYEKEADPRKKRINAAMLAGAIFNRATDIFANVADLEDRGIKIKKDNVLLQECGNYFQEALELGKQVKHYSGEEGVDELWGEPFKAFTMDMDEFFKNRYIKLSQTFRAIDQIVDRMADVFNKVDGFSGVLPLLEELREASKIEAETMRRDEAIYTVWPRFVASKEAVKEFKPSGLTKKENSLRYWEDGLRLLHRGNEIIGYLAGVRVPMPVTTKNYMSKCDLYEKSGSLDSVYSIPDKCFKS